MGVKWTVGWGPTWIFFHPAVWRSGPPPRNSLKLMIKFVP